MRRCRVHLPMALALCLSAALAAPPARVATAAAAPAPSAGPPIEAGPFRAPDLVEPRFLDPSLRFDIRYARVDNFLKQPVYPQARLFLQRPAAEALLRVHRALKEKGYGLLLFDGYRPWSVTRQFWELTPPDRRIFVADPKEGSRHNRGCAVDLTLYSLGSGLAVEMPSAYDEMTERAYATYAGGDEAPRSRRDLLRAAMEKEGFFVYPYEWWHFDYKDWRDYPILDLAFAEAEKASARPAAAGGSLPDSIDLRTARVVDLTYPFDDRTLYWPTSPTAFTLTRLSFGRTDAGYFYASNAFCAPEHGGTHLDAPIHFAEGGRTADQVPPRQLMAPAVVIDVAAAAAEDPDYRLTADDVRRWEQAHGTIPSGAIVLLRTGWGARWPDRKRYFGDDAPNDASHLHFPSYGKEAAEILVKERKAGALGVDTASIDHGPSKDFIVHQVALGADVPGLENLAHLEDLPVTGAWVVALPMKIASGSGGPLRIVALIPPER